MTIRNCLHCGRPMDITGMVSDIRAFHEKFGLDYRGEPRWLPPDLQEMREKFLQEELDEYILAVINRDPEKAIDGLIDLIYVALGHLYLHGFPIEKAWALVHEKNMQKVRAQFAKDSTRGTTFDVIKPLGWAPPNHSKLVWPLEQPAKEVAK